MSTKRREPARRIRDANGETLCSCGCGQVPKPPRQTWFSKACVDQWREKNDPAFIRQQLKLRDKGICAACGCDAEAEYKGWISARKEVHRLLMWLEQKEEWRIARTVPHEQRHDWHQIARMEMWPDCMTAGKSCYKKIAIKREAEIRRLMGPHRDGWTAGRKTGWDADHILEVVNGGGLCDLFTINTLP